jgi:hypothetical protein
MIGTAIADRYGSRLRHLVYVDAIVPKPGESWSSAHSSAMREARLAAAQASLDFSIPPPDPSVFGLAGDDYEWVKRRQTPQPGHTYESVLQFDPLRVAAIPRTFVNCTQPAIVTIDGIRPRLSDRQFWDGAWQAGGGARVVELKTGHDPMISASQDLTRILLDCAA